MGTRSGSTTSPPTSCRWPRRRAPTRCSRRRKTGQSRSSSSPDPGGGVARAKTTVRLLVDRLGGVATDRLGQVHRTRMRSTSILAEQGDPHRLAALAALASAAVLAILGIDIVVSQFPRGPIVLAGLALALTAAWYGLTRTGGARLLGSGIATLAVAGIVAVSIADGDHLAQALVIVVALGLML